VECFCVYWRNPSHHDRAQLSIPPPVTVAIVEDNPELREELIALFSGFEGFGCVASYSTAEEALQELPAVNPKVILMDINLPGMSGIECVRRLKSRMPMAPVVMLTVYEDDESIFESLKAGAVGYMLKKSPPAKILEAIREVHCGGSPMSNQIARRVLATFQAMPRRVDDDSMLSPREREILDHVARGLRYKEIADTLYISTDTVRTHLRNVYRKLQVRSATEALFKTNTRPR
jgi:DNA-binding NarL/FixJ family response regulator